ncbi:hypothetical protein QYM36_005955 [Artemia franciscana]|uniref:Reverse transcriptase domain-containing protein n=1 Tax=Artemia franciscana TaxID=6661 RepID=A0AA88I5N5_ARTSF|nr:hypothetical protein QYM36_005955 [Artemia franciscana]
MDVLTSTIQSLNDSAMGEDLVHNKMLRALPPTFLVPLLYLFNRCWESGTVPSAWKSSILVPIYKGKGDRSDPASYRPIALTSCIAKLYEKMIKLRFEPLIDNSLIAEQAGFRKGRSTLDNLIQLDHDIKKAFTRKRVVSAVFFDIKKAYDTLDPFAILRQAHKFNVGNNFWKWCRAMLFNRTIKTRVGSICSSASTVSLGVPQGGVLSPLLFNILINDIILADMPSIKFVLYADDLALWTEGSSPEACQPKLQGAIDKLSIWLNTKNLVFSIPKTTGMIFSRKIDLRQDCLSINLTLYKQQIHFARNVKFLGMWLDSKLNWNVHISHLCDALEKRLNFMRAVAGQKWGASRDSLRKLFTSIIYGKIEYCLPVYYSASKTLISKIESIVHHGLRLITGALKRYYRVTYALEKTYTSQLNDPVSPEFERLSRELEESVESLFEDEDPEGKPKDVGYSRRRLWTWALPTATFLLDILAKRRETCDEEFALVFEQVKELSDKIQLAVEVPRITQRQVYRNNPPYTTPEEYYRRVVFIPILDSVISDLKSRFSKDTLNSFRLTVLLPSNIVNCTDDLLQSSVKEISSMYGQLLGLTMPSTRATLILAEVHVWRSRWPRVKREGGIFPSSVEETAKECDRHLFPYVSSLLEIFISLPVSVASAERSFSTLRKLKTWLRAQMGQTRLNGSALLNVHRNIDISIDRVIDRHVILSHKITLTED